MVNRIVLPLDQQEYDALLGVAVQELPDCKGDETMNDEQSRPAECAGGQTTIQGWAIVELMGHNVIAGQVAEQTIAGAAFLRVDVPGLEGQPGFTKLFGGAAIYAITPTTEEMARQAAGRLATRPVSLWVVPDGRHQLPALVVDGETDENDDSLSFSPQGFPLSA